MRTRIPLIVKRHALSIRRGGTNVILTWTVNTGGTTNPVTGGVTGGTTTTETLTIKGLIKTEEARSVLRQFDEIEEGDLIVDFAPDAPLDGKTGLRFTIDGQVYEQAKIGKRLAKAWDTIFAGKRTVRTVLLKKAT